jgi:hypothetical protein
MELFDYASKLTPSKIDKQLIRYESESISSDMLIAHVKYCIETGDRSDYELVCKLLEKKYGFYEVSILIRQLKQVAKK